MILTIIICFPCVSAADANHTDSDAQICDVIKENTLTDDNTDAGNFTDLKMLISQSENELTLDKNYRFNSSTDKDFDGFLISKDNYVVDGCGHTVDGSGQVRIFVFTGTNITLKNIKIINARGTYGSAVWFKSLNTVDNCSFINNSASALGGALYINDSVSGCKINSTFINNSAYNGGAIFFRGETSDITLNGYYECNTAERVAGAILFIGKSSNNKISAEFYSNCAEKASGGAIFFYNMAENNLFESIFRYNTAAYGGGIFFYNKANSNKFISDFIFNAAESCGGAMFFYNTTNGNNFTGYFINNTARGNINVVNGNGGAITFKGSSSNSIFTCVFINNTARLYGGGVNYRQTPHNITFNSNFTNNNAKFGGGVNFFESFKEVVFNGQLTGNSAVYGGAIALGYGIIENVSFKYNHAEYGGAVYFSQNGFVINSSFTNNSADNADDSCGGAICFNGNGTVISSRFVNNTAGYFGGAVYIWEDGTVMDSIFTSNEAQNGGSLYVHGAFEVDNCNFTNNSARTGGAIEFWKSGTLGDSNFISNAAGFSGGAVYTSANIKIGNCNFTGNSANENSGGAVYIFGFGELYNTIFTSNSASYYGGAVYFNKNGTVNHSSFTKNSAKDGGAILTAGNLTITNSEFRNNAAVYQTNHLSVKKHAVLTLINVIPNALIFNVSNITYGGVVRIFSNVFDENNMTLNNGTLSIIIAGNVYSADVVNGTANVEIPNLNAGDYNVNITYTGNERVAVSPVAFTVFKRDAVISSSDMTYIINYGGKYSIILKDAQNNALAGKTVSFKLDGMNIGSAVSDENGVAAVGLEAKILKALKSGSKNLVIQLSDSNYNAAPKTVKIMVNRENTKIAAKNKKFKRFKKLKKYTISMKNSKGKAIKKVRVSLKVKGKTYKAKTNSNGKAIFKIKKLTKKGTYKAVIKFKGNKYYNAVTKKVKIKIR